MNSRVAVFILLLYVKFDTRIRYENYFRCPLINSKTLRDTMFYPHNIRSKKRSECLIAYRAKKMSLSLFFITSVVLCIVRWNKVIFKVNYICMSIWYADLLSNIESLEDYSSIHCKLIRMLSRTKLFELHKLVLVPISIEFEKIK